MALVEERNPAAQSEALAACRNAVEVAYRDWVQRAYEAHTARCLLLQPWPRRSGLWGNVFRGVATVGNLFPDTLQTYAYSAQLCFSFLSTEQRDTFADDWYSVGHDFYVALCRGPEDQAYDPADERPFQHEFDWSDPAC
jgi:hypothetical protein